MEKIMSIILCICASIVVILLTILVCIFIIGGIINCIQEFFIYNREDE